MRNKKLIVLLTIVLVLVLSIVTCGATFLVRDVNAYCYYEHADIEEYNKKVVEKAGIKLNSSMFFVDEVGIKNNIEKAYPDIEVINVRRGFPDTVTINYVIYEKSFQYKKGDRYYQCYSSGRIGEVSGVEMPGYFTVKPSGTTSDKIGNYFQSENGKDRKYVDRIIAFFRSKGMIDYQITQLIKFVDLTRDGYVYIRTNAGVSIEIHDSGVKFEDLLDRAFAVYAKKDPQWIDVEVTKGLIKAYPNFDISAGDNIRCVYSPSSSVSDDEAYYKAHYDLNS